MRKSKRGQPSARHADRPDERAPATPPDESLGYAQDAGHPGGLQDLRKKRDTEDEHDTWERHG
jgi:hypothetical protein